MWLIDLEHEVQKLFINVYSEYENISVLSGVVSSAKYTWVTLLETFGDTGLKSNSWNCVN